MFEQLIAQALTTEGLILISVFTIQGALLTYDEVLLHRSREMPLWERLGHPIDTLFFLLPFAIAGFLNHLMSSQLFICLSILSSIIILKDEWVHVGRINVKESLVHAALFILHPVTLYWGYINFLSGHQLMMQQIAVTLAIVCVIQILYWNYFDYKLQQNKRVKI